MSNVSILWSIVRCQDLVFGHATNPLLALATHGKYTTRRLTHTPNSTSHLHAGKVGQGIRNCPGALVTGGSRGPPVPRTATRVYPRTRAPVSRRVWVS